MVVDAPASGHGMAMLTTPRTFGEIARVGPIRRQAGKIQDMLGDPERTGYVAVALPEEMPVVETLELGRKLPEAVGLGLEAIIVNGVWPERFSEAEAEALRAATVNGHDPEAAAVLQAALSEHERATDAARPPRAAGARGRRPGRTPSPTCSSPSSASPSTRRSPTR